MKWSQICISVSDVPDSYDFHVQNVMYCYTKSYFPTGRQTVARDCKSDSPTSHQASTEQREAVDHSQAVSQTLAVPISKTMTKVNL